MASATTWVSAARIELQRPGAEEVGGVTLLARPAGKWTGAFVDGLAGPEAQLAASLRPHVYLPAWHVHLVDVWSHPTDTRRDTLAGAACAARDGLPVPAGHAQPLSPASLRAAFAVSAAEAFTAPAADQVTPGDEPLAVRVQLWLRAGHLSLTVADHGTAVALAPEAAAALAGWPGGRAIALTSLGLGEAGEAHQAARAARLAVQLAARAAAAIAAG